jgi:hypothetical protein
MKKYMTVLLAAGLMLSLLPAAAFADPVVSIDPSYAQRKLRNGDHHKIRMHVTLSGAQNLISFGVKLVYDETEFTVLEHHKNDAVWDAGMDSVVAGNEVFFTGGSTTPVSGDDILLGWVVFQFKGCPDDMPKAVPVTVSLAKFPPYDNFVDTSAPPDNVIDGTVTFNNATVCLVKPTVDACEGDFDGDGDVDAADVSAFRAAYRAKFPAAAYDPAFDFDADGRVYGDDSLVFRADDGRTDCPACE